VSIQNQATEQYFHVIIMTGKLVQNLLPVDETLVCDHSNESYLAVLPCGTVYYDVQGCSNF